MFCSNCLMRRQALSHLIWFQFILAVTYKRGPGRILRDIGQILKGIWDTFVKIQSTFSDMVIQSFLKLAEFWGYLPILRDISKYLMGNRDPTVRAS